MSCIINNGYEVEVCAVTGGNSVLYLANHDDTKQMGLSMTASVVGNDLNIISAFTGTTASFFEFEAELEEISFTEDVVKGNKPTISWYAPTVTFNITNLTAYHKSLINSLVKGKFVAIIKDNASNYHYIGAFNGLRASAATIGTGQAWADDNGATITLSGQEVNPSFIVDPTAVTDVIVPN